MPNVPVCPASTKARFVISNALLIGGVGKVSLSSHNIPKHSLSPLSVYFSSTSSHRLRTAIGSRFHGSRPAHAFINTDSPSALPLIGPRTERTESCPKSELAVPRYGTRPADGRRPYIPQNADGILTDPPMSEPIPRGLPFIAINAPSPMIQ